MRVFLCSVLIPAQAAVAVIALSTLAMWPPAAGRMLLVPLSGGDANAVARTAIAGGAALLGTGPFPGSLVVIGNRARLARIASWGLVIMAPPPAGCGGHDTTGAL